MKFIFLLPAFILFFGVGSAQRMQDTSFVQAAKSRALEFYKSSVGVQSKLYNGRKHFSPFQNLEQHPYFKSEDLIIGSVFYDSELFHDVPLMLDLSRGELITEHLTSGQLIELVREKLKYFSIGDFKFENITDSAIGLPQKGYYQIIYDGPSRVVARKQKILQEKTESQTLVRFYDVRNRYFILDNGLWLPAQSRRSALKIFEDRKQELRKFARQQKLYFKDDREKFLARIAEHYDQLR